MSGTDSRRIRFVHRAAVGMLMATMSAFAVIPVQAHADDIMSSTVLDLQAGPAWIEGFSCSSVNEAIGLVGTHPDVKGNRITMFNGSRENVVVPSGKDIVLDLSGCTLANDLAKPTITVEPGAKLTLVNSIGDGVLDNTAHGCPAIMVEEGGVAALDGGVVRRSREAGTLSGNSANGNSYYTIVNHGTLTINEGAVVELKLADGSSAGFSSIIENGWYSGAPANPSHTARLIINGGVIDGGKYVKNDSHGVMEIHGGQIKNGAAASVLNWNGLVVSGGSFDPADSASGGVFNLAASPTAERGSVKISGGFFKMTGDQAPVFTEDGANASKDITVTGGTFMGAPPRSEYVDPELDMVQLSDGSYVVHKHQLKAVAELPATCRAEGVRSHWVCSVCGLLFATEQGDDLVEEADLVLPKAPHRGVHVPARQATVKTEGLLEHWKCESCGVLFADEGLTKAIAEKDVVVPTLKPDTNKPAQPPHSNDLLPQTGDNSMLPVFLIGVAGAAVVIVGLVVSRRRK